MNYRLFDGGIHIVENFVENSKNLAKSRGLHNYVEHPRLYTDSLSYQNDITSQFSLSTYPHTFPHSIPTYPHTFLLLPNSLALLCYT